MGKKHAFPVVRWNRFIAAGALALAVGTANAVESTTEIFVSRAAVITGNPGTGPKISYLSVPVVRPVLYSGIVTALGSGSLTDANASWTQGQFNGANGPHYVEFDSGVMADILQTQSSTDTLVHAGNLSGLVNVGERFRVRRHLTLPDIFGPNNEAGLQAGPNENLADNVLIQDPQTRATMTYFYYATDWYDTTYASVANMPIYPEQGLMIRRRATGNLVVYVNGNAREGETRVPVYPGYNLVGTLKGSKNMMLSELGLYTGNPATGLQGGLNTSAADTLLVVRPDSSTITYFYLTSSGNEGWHDVNYANADTTTIPAGSAFFVNRKSASGLFHWYIPAE